MNPWNIVGWLIVWIIAICFLGPLLGALHKFILEIKLDRKSKKAHAGKLVCEATDCSKISEVRTLNGFYCREDARKTSRFSSLSFAAPLDYLSEKK